LPAERRGGERADKVDKLVKEMESAIAQADTFIAALQAE